MVLFTAKSGEPDGILCFDNIRIQENSIGAAARMNRFSQSSVITISGICESAPWAWINIYDRFFDHAYTRRMKMKLSAPKTLTWWIAVVLGVLGLLGSFVSLPVISGLSFWLLFLGFAVLAVATFVEGM
jgi:hypothetical protein